VRRCDWGFGGTASLLLAVAVAAVLTGCGTVSGLAKLDSAPTAMPPPAAPAATGEPVLTGEPAVPEVALVTIPPAPSVDREMNFGPRPDDPVVEVEGEPAPVGTVLLGGPIDLDRYAGAALAQSTQSGDPLDEEYDPWEPFNEKTFEFNRRLDRYVLKPVAWVYKHIIPEPWQVLIANGFDNISFVPRFINSLLQGKWGGAGREVARFLINSTAGIGGVFDPAKDYWGIPKSREDFGQTLGVWGSGPGPYLIVPFLEPLTVRDGIGKFVDGLLDPLAYFVPFFWTRAAMKAGDIVNDRALNYDLFQGFEESVLDMYSAVRHGYLQRRQQLIKE
jgi:phospholipid-binding lipoprotein MlaA